MLNFAHRGYSGLYPENTMLAFEMAYKEGIDGIEFDVQMTADGVLVVCHDEHLLRLANKDAYLKDLTYSELLDLDFSFPWQGKHGVHKIPSLDEFLFWAKDKNLELNLEFKTSLVPYNGIVPAAIQLVKKYGLEDKMIYSSFNHETVIEVKKIEPEYKCGFLTESVMLEPKITALNMEWMPIIRYF